MSITPEWVWSCDMTIPGFSDEKNKLVEKILLEMQRRNWSEREMFDVHIALEEALSNALKHGNASDPSKKIQIHCWLTSDRITLEIADEGAGFNPDSIPDPRHPDHLLIPSGRGLLIIRHHMTTVNFSSSGNTIIMEKVHKSPDAT